MAKPILGPRGDQSEPPASAAMTMLHAANLGGKAINLTQTTAPHAMSYKLTSELASLTATQWPYALGRCGDTC